MTGRRQRRSGRRSTRTTWAAVLGVLAVTGVLGACSGGSRGTNGAGTDAASVAVVPTTVAVPVLRWVALGDSYSAGHGGSRSRVVLRSSAASTATGPTAAGPTAAGGPAAGSPTAGGERAACMQAEADSYARRATELLGPRPIELTLAACGGALSSDLTSQLAAAGPAGRTDVATVTVGGNDIGFGELIRQCSSGSCPDLAADLADLPGVPGTPGGADRTAGAGGPGSTGTPGTTGATDWDLLGDRLTARFGDLAGWLRPGGTLVVLTYPLPFPERAGACPTGVGLNRPEDAALVNAAIVRLDDTVVAAAARAGQQHRDRTITVIEWRTPDGTTPTSERTAADGSMRRVGWNPAGICGSDPMLNGLRLDTELADSFHPSDRGLDLAAAAVAGEVQRLAGH